MCYSRKDMQHEMMRKKMQAAPGRPEGKKMILKFER
jgi:hypothetical protein